MFQSVLKHLGGIEQYGVFSLCLFCSMFVAVLIWAFMQKKSHLDYMARVALESEQPEKLNRRQEDE